MKKTKSISFLAEIKKKEVEPKIYAMYFDEDEGDELKIVLAYDLEEAAKSATGKDDVLPSLWDTMEIKDLRDKITFFEMKEHTSVVIPITEAV